MDSLATSQAADMKLSHIMTDITNIFPLLPSMMRPDRLLLPAININKGSKSVVAPLVLPVCGQRCPI